MILWIFNHYAESPKGSATRTFDFSKELQKEGIITTIFASSFSHYRLREEHLTHWWELFKMENHDGVRFVWLRGWPYKENNWRRLFNISIFGLLAMIIALVLFPKPNVVIGTSVHPFAGLAGWVIARLSRARFLVEVHDLWPQALVEFGYLREGSLKTKLLRGLEKFLYNQAERIIMLWRNTDKYLDQIGIPSQKAVWIPHGVETHKFSNLNNVPNLKNPGLFKVMYFGSFVQNAALDVILEAALILQQSNCTHIKFVLVGDGVEKGRILERTKILGLTQMEICDPVPRKKVPEMIREASALVCCIKKSPVYKYGVSMNKMCDYLISGKPIVFSGDSAYDPVRESGAGISVPGESPEALARAIKAISDLPIEQRLKMGSRGIAWAVEHHDIRQLTNRLKNVLVNETTLNLKGNDH